MTTQISKWGNSLGIRIPKAILEESGIGINDEVTISCKEGAIIIKKRYSPFNWYEWLKNEIERDMKHLGSFDEKYEYYKGQIEFAYLAKLVTEAQKDELKKICKNFSRKI